MSEHKYNRYIIGRYSAQGRQFNTFIQEITEKEVAAIEARKGNEAINLNDEHNTIVWKAKIICYGQINLRSDEEIEAIRASKITDTSICVPSHVNLETGEMNDKFFDSEDKLRLLIHGYVKIGKPKYIIVYHETRIKRDNAA